MSDPHAPRVKDPTKKRGSFGPVVLIGLASGALVAIASAKAWVEPSGGASHLAAVPGDKSAATSPLAEALALLLLATWGILLVTRGRVRRCFAVIGLVTAAGLVATVVVGHHTLPRQLVDSGVIAQTSAGTSDIGFTGWYWAAGLGVLVSLVATALAVRLVPGWPAMGSRYDAPGSQTVAAEPQTDQELWRALDEGHDPTTPREP